METISHCIYNGKILLEFQSLLVISVYKKKIKGNARRCGLVVFISDFSSWGCMFEPP